MWQVARRPRWIGALLLALAIAAGFAALGQWQLARSIQDAAPPSAGTETVMPLEAVSRPQEPVPAAATGQLVRLEATFVPGDYVILSDRLDVSGSGYWVVGHAILADGDSLAVALGRTSSEDAAASAIRALESHPPAPLVTGRYLPTESPQQSDFENGVRSALAVPELVNLWGTRPAGVHGGYVIAGSAPPGLDLIDAPAPITEVSLNLLNVFYAAEWVVFAGFAMFLWYRLVRDAWEAEAGGDGRPDENRIEE
jgi:surfeit locus 1 family protein